MTPRERVLAALNHEQPDRVPIDLSGHRSSGIAAIAYRKLRTALGLPERTIRVYDPVQQLAIVDEDVLQRFGVDAIELGRGFALEDEHWADWTLPDPRDFRTYVGVYQSPTTLALRHRVRGADFAVLPLCIDDAGIGRGRQFYDEIGLDALPLYWAEPLRVQLALAFIGLPTTLLIDRQSREIGRLQGPFAWDSDDAVEQIVGAF